MPGSGSAFVEAIDELIAGSASTMFLLAAPFAGGPPQGLAFGKLTSWRAVEEVSEPGFAAAGS